MNVIKRKASYFYLMSTFEGSIKKMINGKTKTSDGLMNAH